MQLKLEYCSSNLSFALYENFIDSDIEWIEHLKENIDFLTYRRNSHMYGDTEDDSKSSEYKVGYGGTKEIKPWKDIRGLTTLKRKVEKIVGHEITVCAIQCYPNGKIGIKPHKDREITSGTIAGISFGDTRTLRLSRGNVNYDFELPHGSLYLMREPTNKYWSHSILPKVDGGERLSMTFRYYKR